MRLDDYDKSKPFDATVMSTVRITPDEADAEIREIVLEINRHDFDYKPGQSIGVLVPGPHEFGHEHHFRLYTVADTHSRSIEGRPWITIAVRRCAYIDEFSGERYKGIASNFLCDRKAGDHIEITGPYGYAFEVPQDKNANLILIGAGTGIAPFRAFVKHIYQDVGNWRGKVRLFYGAHTGLELVYMNEHRDDFTQYYDEDTFQAFKALSPRPHWADPIAWDYCLEKRSEEIVELLGNPATYVYVAGLEATRDQLDEVFGDFMGSSERWQRRKAELVAGGRWTELLY
ncbi:MAG: ferredoxin-NADP reductase [Gammaproteobacteria bacterium]|nr:ferredoxin-NADP reductase [Gammaproteobacteria bacterium]